MRTPLGVAVVPRLHEACRALAAYLREAWSKELLLSCHFSAKG